MKNLLLCGLATLSASSFAASFNFDSETAGAYTSGTSFNNNGLNLTVNSSGGWFHVTSQAISSSQGTLSVFANNRSDGPFSPSFNAIEFVFDQDVTNATLIAGDGGGDNDANIVVNLYDGNDNFVNSYTQFLGTSGDGVSFIITDTFRKAVVDSTGTFNPHSISAEFSEVEAVPEPATLTLLGLGALAALRRKKATR